MICTLFLTTKEEKTKINKTSKQTRKNYTNKNARRVKERSENKTTLTNIERIAQTVKNDGKKKSHNKKSAQERHVETISQNTTTPQTQIPTQTKNTATRLI